MMKKILLLIIMISTSAYSFCQQQLLHVQANKIVAADGKIFTIHGVNLGGWLLWEGWIMGGGFTKESDLKKRLHNLMNDEDYTSFIQSYYENYITEKDIEAIANHGFNCVRVPLNYRLFTNEDVVNGYAISDKLIGWCKKYNVHIILDMHAAPGGQNNFFISDNSNPNLLNSENNQQKTIKLWKEISSHYKNESIVAGYDLLNEPKLNNTQTLLDFYNRLIQTIRSNGDEHILMIEGNDLAHSFKNFTAFADKNIAYSFHYYTWFAEKNKAASLQKIIQDIPANASFFCGEWGEDNPQNLTEASRLLASTKGNCGDMFWTWKRTYKNNGRLPLNTISTSPEWNRVAKYLTLPVGKPDATTVSKGTQSFIESININNCTLNRNTLQAITSK